MTTWAAFGNLFVEAVKNPVVVLSVLVSLFNAINDPTTKGLSDSERAMSYDKPAE
jgi:phi LC3 family holin